MQVLCYLKNRNLGESKSDLHNTARWKCIMIQTKDIPKYLQKKQRLMLTRLEKFTKLFLKSLDSTSPLLSRSCINRGSSTSLLSTQERPTKNTPRIRHVSFRRPQAQVTYGTKNVLLLQQISVFMTL